MRRTWKQLTKLFLDRAASRRSSGRNRLAKTNLLQPGHGRFEPLEDRRLLSLSVGADLEPLSEDALSRQVEIGIADSPPPSPVSPSFLDMTSPASAPPSAVLLNDVPTSTWTYGCGPTAVGMLFGYYDRIGYDNIYTGPANGGVAPLTDLGQGMNTPIAGAASLIATQNGFDGRVTPGHVDDYWTGMNDAGPDPWESGGVEHEWDCVADYLGTSQWKWDNNDDGLPDRMSDGSTWYLYWNDGTRMYDPQPGADLGYPRTEVSRGMRLFAESRGYSVDLNYNQLTDNVTAGGFSFEDYMAEIDAGRPVLIHVVGHMMTGVGYDEATNAVYLHDTWGNVLHSMTWGISYAGMDMRAVTVFHLDPLTPTVLRVDADATPGGDGTSWGAAYDTLQGALSTAETRNADGDPGNDIDEIWIAEGTYRPTDLLDGADPRTATFEMLDSVKLFGGFSGVETTIDQRPVDADGMLTVTTILSGDLNGDDATGGDNSENAYTVVFASELTSVNVDGVTITGANANGAYSSDNVLQHLSCGAMFVHHSNLNLNQVTFSDNHADVWGAGLRLKSAIHVVVRSCTFDNNHSNDSGGAINVTNSRPLRVFDSLFTNNSAYFHVGAIDFYRTKGAINNCQFYDNACVGDAAANAGAVRFFASAGAKSDVVECVFSGNQSQEGGALVIEGNASVAIINSTITANDAAIRGGGIHDDTSGDITVVNSIITGNTSPDGADVKGTIVETGPNFIGVDPLFVDPAARRFDLQSGSAAIDVGDNDAARDPYDNLQIAWDITGAARIQDGDFNGTPTVDLGAYEFLAVSSPPSITTGAAASIPENSTLAIDVQATDPDGDVEGAGLTYSLTGGADQALFGIDPDTGELTFLSAPDFESPTDAGGDNVYDVQVTVTDTAFMTDVQDIAVTVTNVDDNPVILVDNDPTANSVPEQSPIGTPVGITALASDADAGATITGYSLIDNAGNRFEIDSATGVVTVKNPGLIDYEGWTSHDVTVRADSSDGGFADMTFTISITNVNEPPRIVSPGSLTGDVGTAVTFTVSASDLDGDDLTFSLDGAVPAGASIDPTSGDFTWTPTESQGPGVYTFDVVVTDDGTPPLDASRTVTITVTEANDAPVLDPIGDKSVDELVELTFTATAVDPEGHDLTFSLGGAVPAGASIDPTSGDFTWTPTESQGPGVYTFDVVVTDDGSPSLADSETITVTVDDINVPPVLDAVGAQSVDELSELTFTATASDADGDDLTFSLGGTVPSGASIDPTSGDFSWTPTESQGPGVYTFDVVVTDDGSPAMSDSETITVTVAEVDDNPVILVDNDATVNSVPEQSPIGTPVGITALANDADTGATITGYSLVDDAGGRFEIDSATGVVTVKNPGLIDYEGWTSHDVTVRAASSDGGSADMTFTISITNVNEPPRIVSPGSQTGDVGTAVTFTVSASDPDGDDLTFSLAGTVPTGASIGPTTGVFTWTPTESQGPGVYTFDVVVTDDGSPSLSDSETITVTVTDVNDAPLLDPIGDKAVNELAELSFTATAVDPEGDDLTFSLGGAVPTGASIDPTSGLFTWTPDATQGPGVYTFDVVVTDDGSPSLGDSETITVTVTEVGESVFLQDGVLHVNGTMLADSISLSLVGGQIRVTAPSLGVSGANFGGVESIIIDSGDGADTIRLDSAIDVPVTVDAGAGNDRVYASSIGANTIHGGLGNDTIHGGRGNDLIDGGAGDDRIYGQSGDDTLLGGDGDDFLYGSSGDDFLCGGDGDDRAYGQSGADTLLGGAGFDVLQGDSGDDLIDGGADSDRIFGSSGVDVLLGGDGDDHIDGGEGDDILIGGNGDDSLFGSSGADTLAGETGDDRLFGGPDDDILSTGGDAGDLVVDDEGVNQVDAGPAFPFSPHDLAVQEYEGFLLQYAINSDHDQEREDALAANTSYAEVVDLVFGDPI